MERVAVDKNVGDSEPEIRRQPVDPDLVRRLGRASVSELMHLLETGTDDERRQAAIEVGERGANEAFSRLIGLLGHSNTDVADGAALGLGDLGDMHALRPVLDAICVRLRRDEDAGVLLFVASDLDARQAVSEFVYFVQRGRYVEAWHSTDGLRKVWDELTVIDQASIRELLKTRLTEVEPEEWRVDFINEILTRGGWTLKERVYHDDG